MLHLRFPLKDLPAGLAGVEKLRKSEISVRTTAQNSLTYDWSIELSIVHCLPSMIHLTGAYIVGNGGMIYNNYQS